MMNLKLSDAYSQAVGTKVFETNMTTGPAWIFKPDYGEYPAKTILTLLVLWSRVHDISLKQFHLSVASPNGDIPVLEWRSHGTYHVVFYHETDFENFQRWLRDHRPAPLFPNLKEAEEISLIPVYFKMDDRPDAMNFSDEIVVTEEIADILVWLHNNIKGNYYRYGDYFMFADPDDAARFRLRFGSHIKAA